jgi:hypothetical protein
MLFQLSLHVHNLTLQISLIKSAEQLRVATKLNLIKLIPQRKVCKIKFNDKLKFFLIN